MSYKFYKFVFFDERPGVFVATGNMPNLISMVISNTVSFYRKPALRTLSSLFHILKATLLIKKNLQLILKNARHQKT